LWLGFAVILTFFSSGQWSFWLAAWVGPVFMPRFARAKKPLAGYVLAVLGSATAASLMSVFSVFTLSSFMNMRRSPCSLR
jgi:hypothetical protein